MRLLLYTLENSRSSENTSTRSIHLHQSQFKIWKKLRNLQLKKPASDTNHAFQYRLNKQPLYTFICIFLLKLVIFLHKISKCIKSCNEFVERKAWLIFCKWLLNVLNISSNLRPMCVQQSKTRMKKINFRLPLEIWAMLDRD